MRSLFISFIAILLLCLSTRSYCQIEGAIDYAPTEWRPLSIGIEGGWMRNLQSGSYKGNCGCKFENGKGNSGIGAFFIEKELSDYFSLGVKLGYDSKTTSSSENVTDEATIRFNPGDSVTSGSFDLIRKDDIAIEYLFMAPYISLTPFGPGLFIQLSPEIGNLISSNFTHTREMSSTIVILNNGDTIKNIRFANGSNREILENSSIASSNKLRLALLFSVGYDMRLTPQFSIFPEVSYHLPLTNIASSFQSTDWKISSYAFSLGVKYNFY